MLHKPLQIFATHCTGARTQSELYSCSMACCDHAEKQLLLYCELHIYTGVSNATAHSMVVFLRVLGDRRPKCFRSGHTARRAHCGYIGANISIMLYTIVARSALSLSVSISYILHIMESRRIQLVFSVGRQPNFAATTLAFL